MGGVSSFSSRTTSLPEVAEASGCPDLRSLEVSARRCHSGGPCEERDYDDAAGDARKKGV